MESLSVELQEMVRTLMALQGIDDVEFAREEFLQDTLMAGSSNRVCIVVSLKRRIPLHKRRQRCRTEAGAKRHRKVLA